MKNKAKFMLIGALMTGMFSLAHAADSKPITEAQIKSSITNILQKQIDKGFFSEHSDVSIKIKESVKIPKGLFGDEKIDTSKTENVTDLSENDLERVGNMCKMRLSFDDQGNIPYLGKGDEIKLVTQFKNERQKDLARQFVALHEQSHCEFSSISNPVIIKGADKKFEEKMNNDLKNLEVLDLGLGDSNKLSYMNTLNESYADVSAMIALIKEYGKDDKDLQFVLKSIGTQRHEAYINAGAESHDTHVAIRKLLTQENLEKIEKINNKEDFRNLALNVSNEGVQTLLTQRPDFAKESLTKEHLDISIIINMMRIIKSETGDKSLKSPSMFKDGIENGLAFNLAKEALKNVDYSKYNFDETKKVDGKINTDSYFFAIEKFEKMNMGKYKDDYVGFRDDMKNFIEIINKNHANETVEFDNKTTKDEIVKKVGMLRNQFLKDSSNNNYEFKGPK